jgi:ATP-dependent protease HslVU (ClpYQ) peptidase subunit
MTCIVGLLHDGGCLVGADSAVSVGEMRGIDRRKVRRRWGVIVGTAGGARECEIALSTRVPAYRRGDVRDWVSSRLAPAVLAAVRAERREAPTSLELLIATPTVLLGVDADGAQYEWPRAWGAVGCGAHVALGSMHCSSGLGWQPRRRVKAALEAAAAHVDGVAGPWTWAEVQR